MISIRDAGKDFWKQGCEDEETPRLFREAGLLYTKLFNFMSSRKVAKQTTQSPI